MSRPRKAMSEWVVHCEVNQRHIRRSHATREAALKDACSQLLQGHAVNRIVGPQKTITGERVRDWCAKHRPDAPRTEYLRLRRYHIPYQATGYPNAQKPRTQTEEKACSSERAKKSVR